MTHFLPPLLTPSLLPLRVAGLTPLAVSDRHPLSAAPWAPCRCLFPRFPSRSYLV